MAWYNTSFSAGIPLGPPMPWLSLGLYPLLPSVQKEVGTLLLRPTCPRRSRTATSGHYHPGKSPSGVETVLSHSTIDNPTNVPTVPPDCLPQAPEGQVVPPYSANHLLDKAELFVPDISYSGNALHHVIVEDVHIVQTRSQARAKGKAQPVVSKPYARQLLDKAPQKRSHSFH
ncbi:hypothetical protein DSO57_1022626 [Entomophthora muscae]|uniref:Uncharacterized protein n=1 Tax=Entomophthora muscae TaxID=34485 RepID=A0ACC2RU84_9FUNG|nr:hypothetical protein DSO57_1022626 [Entomophthora muscae]